MMRTFNNCISLEYLSDILNTFVTKTDLVYEIISEDGYNTTNEVTVPDAPEKIIDSYPIDVNETHHYTLKLTYKNINRDQSDNVGSKFFAKIRLNEYNNYSLSYLVDGKTFNLAIKQLASPSVTKFSDFEYNIKNIVNTKSAPTPDKTTINLETGNSDNPILAWYDNNTVYIYTKSSKIFANGDAGSMFMALKGVEELNLNWLYTSSTTKMTSMFYVSSFKTLILGKNFDTSNVTKMDGMFAQMSYLTTLDFGNKFDTSKVETMRDMFRGMQLIQNLTLPSSFTTKNCLDTAYMFHKLNSIKTLSLGQGFDTSKVTDMTSMFSNCDILQTINLGPSFSVQSAIYTISMFDQNTVLKTIYVPETIDFSSVTYSEKMFKYDYALTGGAGTTYDQNIIDNTYAKIDDGDTNKGYFTSLPNE